MVLGGARPRSRPFFVLFLLLLSLFFARRVSAPARGPFRGFNVCSRQRSTPTQERAGHRAGFLGTEAKTTWHLKMSLHTTAPRPCTSNAAATPQKTAPLHAARNQAGLTGTDAPQTRKDPSRRQPRRLALMDRLGARRRATLALSHRTVTLHQRLLTPPALVFTDVCAARKMTSKEKLKAGNWPQTRPSSLRPRRVTAQPHSLAPLLLRPRAHRPPWVTGTHSLLGFHSRTPARLSSPALSRSPTGNPIPIHGLQAQDTPRVQSHHLETHRVQAKPLVSLHWNKNTRAAKMGADPPQVSVALQQKWGLTPPSLSRSAG